RVHRDAGAAGERGPPRRRAGSVAGPRGEPGSDAGRSELATVAAGSGRIEEMSVTFIFGIHNHQPLGNFDEVLEEAARKAYRPFLQTLARFPEVRALVHTSGLLLEWWEAHVPDVIDLLGELAGRGQVEPLTGGFTEP